MEMTWLSLAFESPKIGITPRTATPGTARSKSSLPLMESSRCSRMNANPIPKVRPNNPARSAVRTGVGANAQEGKTTTLVNLAVAFAASGMRTVVVDCDLRRPRIHEFFNMDNNVGFTSVLLGNVAMPKALQPVPGQDRLLVLTSGPLPPNPSELLTSQRTTDLLGSLSAQADVVLVDSPPTLPVTDALVLSQRVDSTVVIATAGKTTQKAAAHAIGMLRQVNAPVAGAVLNGVTPDSGYASYSYGYYSANSGHAVPNGSHNGVSGEKKSRRRGHRRSKRP